MKDRAPLARIAILAFATGIGAVFAPTGFVRAQNQPAATDGARYVVPNIDGVLLRCNPGTAWYPVATLTRRSVLKVVGEAEGWLRVEYPRGTPAVVKSDEVELNQGRGTATLTRRSRLRAYNPADPVFEESFKAVYDDFLLPGVEMKYLGELRNRQGAVTGLLVEAPAGATGYVLARDVRDAAPSEVAQFAAPAAPAEAPSPAQPTPTQTAQAPATQPESTPAAQPTEPEPAVLHQTLPPPSPATADARSVAEQRAMDEAASTPAAPSLKALDAEYERIQKQPITQGDPTELIEQYRQYAATLGTEGANQSALDYVSARIQALELRAKLQQTQAQIDALEKATEEAGTGYRDTIARLAQTRDYLVVGRLLPSTIYDGERLPLLYRLVSIDSTISRTLAYITPEAELDLDAKAGAIVGVLSDKPTETTEMVSVIRPSVVDVLQAAPGR